MEVWKDIKGYEGYYKVSNMGRMIGLNGNGKGTKKILKCRTDKDGYLEVTLCKDGVHKYSRVHRLVGLTFIKNESEKSQINHINGVKNDNRVCNLEWVTRSENILHSVNVLGNISNTSGLNPPLKVTKLNLFGKIVSEYRTVTEACKIEKMSKNTLSKYAKSKEPFKGHYWEVAN